MPTAIFEDKDLIESIAMLTGYRPNKIHIKKINDKGQIEVFWK